MSFGYSQCKAKKIIQRLKVKLLVTYTTILRFLFVDIDQLIIYILFYYYFSNKDMDINASVTLVIRAPNQRIEDHTVECMLGWTVKMLKKHLEDVYPSNPVSSHLKKGDT